MARPRKPVAVMSKHLTAAERDEREKSEVKLSAPSRDAQIRVWYPSALPKELKEEFRGYAVQLIRLGIFLNEKHSGDADALCDYLIFRKSYLEEIQKKQEALEAGELGAVKLFGGLAQKDYTAAASAAAAIGLTVKARCQLVLPKAADDPADDAELDDMLGGRIADIRRARTASG